MHTRSFDELLYKFLRDPESAEEYLRLAKEEGEDSYASAQQDVDIANKQQTSVVRESQQSPEVKLTTSRE